MKVLVVGSGGREHAMAWKAKLDDPAAEIILAPGNGGTEGLGRPLPVKPTDVGAILDWAKAERPDVTLVGPEGPLCAGLADALAAEGLVVFGPNRRAAQLEGSKVFTKALLQKHGIPTARAGSFSLQSEALKFSQELGYPQVVKADGLAAGKGVIIAASPWEAAQAIDQIMRQRVFGAAGDQVVLEEFLTGREASIHVLTDGEACVVLPVSQDHKRVGDGDTGPNTGGMGAYAPAPLVDDAMLARIRKEILEPTLEAFRREGIDYKGVLYAGLMLTAAGPKVLEFNVRFGDPETQVLLPLLRTPLVEIARAVHERKLGRIKVETWPRHAVAVVLAAAGYPEAPRLGDEIRGLEEAAATGEAIVFHAGTRSEKGRTVTAGGRVLAVTSVGQDLAQARERAYAAAGCIQFAGAHYRRDIAARTGAS